MNSNILFGIITFLAWSAFCTWHYTCNIQGLCLTGEAGIEEAISTFPTNKVNPELTENEPTENKLAESDTVSVIEEIELPVINFQEDKIYFLINSSQLANPDYVDNFIIELKTKIENREVEFRLEGFTCDLGSEEYNQKLGLKRAKAMESLLKQNDINSSKIKVTSGGEIPSLKNNDEERKLNRKVIITIKSTDQ